MLKSLTPAVLSIDLLNQINNHYTSTLYKHRTPLLRYTPEAVAIFALTLYNQTLRPSGLYSEATLENYLDYFTKPYREAMDDINPVLEGFIGDLEVIVAEPRYTAAEIQPHSISRYIHYHKTGEDIDDGYNAKYFPTLYDFFFSIYSPLLTYPYVGDREINNMKYKSDTLQRRHSEVLVKFIREELYTLRDQLRELKEMPRDKNPKNDAQIDYNLPPEIEVILENFLNEATAKVQAEAEARQAQVEANAKAEVRIQTQAQEQQQEPKTLTPEEYLDLFICTLEPHYAALSSKYEGLHLHSSDSVITRLDETFAHVYAGKYANANNLDLNTVLAQQTQGQSVILSFDNIKPVLSDCILCYLYNLAPQDVLPPEVLDHGVVKGILEATERYAPDIARRGYRPNADLAEALYDKILSNTNGFATTLPLPDVAPQTTKSMTAKAKELTHRESVSKGDILPFDLTRPLAKVIHDIRADTVTAYTKFLLVSPDPNTLTPVDIKTIKDIAYALIGHACTPYLLNGDLVIHNKEANEYYKIIPNIDNDGYASYGFRIYSYQNLSSRIYRKQNLLKTSVDYFREYSDERYYDPFDEPNKKTITDEDLGHIKYQPLPSGDPKKRLETFADLEDWDKTLTDRINDTFDDPDYYEAHTKAQEQYRKINAIQYYHPNVIFVSAHKLAAYVYFPQEYSDLIIRKPLDPETGEPLTYHPHHKDGNRSNNAKENLEIISEQLNYELRSTSRPVIYLGKHYNTIKSYCEDTDAGAHKKLINRLSALTSDTDAVPFNGRLYTIDPETDIIIATDDAHTTVITYNGTVYANPKEFTDAHKLLYKSLHNALSNARKENKTSFKYKYYQFYLDNKGNITKVTK